MHACAIGVAIHKRVWLAYKSSQAQPDRHGKVREAEIDSSTYYNFILLVHAHRPVYKGGWGGPLKLYFSSEQPIRQVSPYS